MEASTDAISISGDDKSKYFRLREVEELLLTGGFGNGHESNDCNNIGSMCSSEVIKRLRNISREPGGFQERSIRARVWPLLAGLGRRQGLARVEMFDRGCDLDSDSHKDTSQIKCDILRSLWSVDVTLGWDDTLRERRRLVMRNIIISILKKHSHLSYYQGFHDIVSIFLLVLEDDSMTFLLSEKISLDYLSDFLQPDFENVVKIMRLIHELVCVQDQMLNKFFNECNLEPFYSTSWLLTWLSHDIKCLDTISRLFDIFLASPPYYIIYFCSAIVLHYRDNILDCDCEFSTVHSLLAKLGEKTSLTDDLESIIQRADVMMERDFSISKLLDLVHVRDLEFFKCITDNKIGLFRNYIITENLKKTKPTSSWAPAQQIECCSTWRFLQSIFRRSHVNKSKRSVSSFHVHPSPPKNAESMSGDFDGSNLTDIIEKENAIKDKSLMNMCSNLFLIGGLVGCSFYIWHKKVNPI